MRTFLIIIGLFLFIGNSFAQSYEELIEKSYDFVDKDDLVSAEESLKTAMRKEPANPLNYALLTNLGTIQRRQGKLQDALISYTSALSGHTKNITILENRASLYTELGETEKALNDYNTLLIEDPEHQEALYCRGLLYIQLQNYMWAEQDFDKILEVTRNQSVPASAMPSWKRCAGTLTKANGYSTTSSAKCPATGCSTKGVQTCIS